MDMLEALKTQVGADEDIDAELKEILAPLEARREKLKDSIAEVKNFERDLQARYDTIDRVIDAARMRKRPGRRAGKPRETAPA